MNPSTAFARVLVDELVRAGVRHAVLSPGSRSAPVALAFAAEPRLTLHVRIDERSAGFFALGVAVETGAPVAVVCTSGTAVANLHPAVLEASFAGVPLVLLTADRPPELRGTGANQTIDQTRIYGGAVRSAVEVGVPEHRIGAVAYWRSVTARALAVATDARHPGPVHLNLALREPLVPDGDPVWPEPLDGPRPGAWTAVTAPVTSPARIDDVLGGPPTERGAVVLGHGAADPREAAALAAALGWPLLSEPSGNGGSGSVPAFALLLADPTFAAAMTPDVVIVVGKPGLSRSLMGWLAGAGRQVVVDPRPDWADPTRSAAVVVPGVPVPAILEAPPRP
ncbi:MAG: 2-succinyl-5-enolpyruvyl-6-hydroxy-3-cyclohexene-1-carboxylic-acid synthase, partial [Geodermatophilaceae bacterium]|nr:2-succinyl-5-enolpyruvyl-6-hydroxy-3-cyclohexene-1-carboxylic-acid synthase [Geodermatophilaceae bacterium]